MSDGPTKDELQARVDELAAERAELWRQAHEQRAHERTLEDLQREVAYMRSTLSWRVTAPLRAGKALQHRARVAWKSRG